MAALTPEDFLEQIIATCADSVIVEAYTLRILDPDIGYIRGISG